VLSVFFTDSNNKRKAKQPETATIDNFPDNSPVATIAAHSTDLETPKTPSGRLELRPRPARTDYDAF